jgi:hypothetical protein
MNEFDRDCTNRLGLILHCVVDIVVGALLIYNTYLFMEAVFTNEPLWRVMFNYTFLCIHGWLVTLTRFGVPFKW